MLQLKVRRIKVFPYLYTLAVVGALLGLVAAAVDLVLLALGKIPLIDLPARILASGDMASDPMVMSLKILVINPVAGFLGLGALGLVLATAYNLAARITGGVTLEPEILVAVGRKGGPKGEVSYEDYIRKHLPDVPEPPAEGIPPNTEAPEMRVD